MGNFFANMANSYFAFVFIMVVMGYTIITNKNMYKSVRGQFVLLILLVVSGAVISAFEDYTRTLTYRNVARLLLSTAGYILRPTIMYVILLILTRNHSRKKHIIYGIPLVVFSLIMLADMPFGNVYGYRVDNSFAPGVIFPITYGVLFLYLGLILVFSILSYTKNRDLMELTAVIIGVGIIVLNILCERGIIGFKGQTQTSISLAVLLYAIYFKSIVDREEKEKLETRELKTGLLNENACVNKLNEMRGSVRLQDYAAVYFDLARFGFVNDQYGMEVGNRVLVEYARTIEAMLRSDEILARQGSDRFIAIVLKRNLDIILDQLGGTQVKFVMDGNKYELTIGAHIGVFMIDSEEIPGEEIISNAYTALSYGKSAGSEITYMTSELKNTIKDDKQFANDIPIAMANEEFIAYYQPKVNSSTNMLCGAEALVRWMRNGHLVSPGRFIPVMENKDLMCDMDFYMLRHVCADISKWIEQGLVPPTISVNFSRRNLSNIHLAADIDAIVKEYHVPKKMIEIEITETIDEFPISVLKNFVDDLHKLGYKVAVDDFGSGSSSLSLLREVTFDTLKIDKGFVDRAYAKDLTILSYMIKLAKAIGLEVLAEGVEQYEQVDTLRQLGCLVIQGYYYDRPLPKEDFEKRVINRRYTNGQD